MVEQLVNESDTEQRFELVVTVKVREVTHGNVTKFFKQVPLSYASMPYAAVLVTQDILREALNEAQKKLIDAGVVSVKNADVIGGQIANLRGKNAKA